MTIKWYGTFDGYSSKHYSRLSNVIAEQAYIPGYTIELYENAQYPYLWIYPGHQRYFAPYRYDAIKLQLRYPYYEFSAVIDHGVYSKKVVSRIVTMLQADTIYSIVFRQAYDKKSIKPQWWHKLFKIKLPNNLRM